MKKNLLYILALIAINTSLSAQKTPTFEEDKLAVIKVINQLFEGMRQCDTSKLRPIFHPQAKMVTTANNRELLPVAQFEEVDSFIAMMKQFKVNQLDERLWNYTVFIDQHLATVHTEYTFFFEGKQSHCGTNIFTLARTIKGWQIVFLADTRRFDSCLQESMQNVETKTINNLMDKWHQDVAKADADAFFGAMAADAIYLGTDITERWLRDDFRKWAKPHFDKKKTWDFKPSQRQVYFSSDYKTAWFEETLDTWMGTCRGSGVLVKEDTWKIKHYNLAPTVPNERMDEVIKLLKSKPKKKK